MSRARDLANLGDQAGSGFDASDLTTGTLGNTVQDNITRLGTVTTGTLSHGTTLQGYVDSSNTGVTFPAGHIIQIEKGERKVRTTNQGTTPVETDLQATITPLSTSNKILIFVTGSWGITGLNLAKFYLYRKIGSGSPANAISGTSGDAWQILQHQIQNYTGSSDYATGFSTALSLSYLDSPSFTLGDELLYELYFASDNALPTVHFNSRPQADNAGYAQITLMEITA